MKKAFDQNVSRAKPRIRLGAAFSELTPPEEMAPEPTHPLPEPARPDLAAEVRARAAVAAAPKPSVVEALQRAIEPVRASVVAPPEVVEIQTPAPPVPAREIPDAQDMEDRRGRLKERLKAVRENP